MERIRNSGAAALVVTVFIGIVVFVLVLGLAFFMWYKAGYNKAVQLDENAKEAWANVDAQVQRRYDLVDNLVETVKGYAQQEQEVFGKIAESRTQYFQSNSVADKAEASNQLSGFLSRLLVLQERYPELKSNQNFLALQDQLEGTENRISVARQRYNQAVNTLNSFARGLFGPFFCRKAGVESREPFEASTGAQTEVPKVNFSASNPKPEPAAPNAP